jgi:hypothetical protein
MEQAALVDITVEVLPELGRVLTATRPEGRNEPLDRVREP